MTNLQALKTKFPSLSEKELKNNLELYNLPFDEEYKPTRLFDWVCYNIVGNSLMSGVTSVREGDYQVVYDKKAWMIWYNQLANKWGWNTYSEFAPILNKTSIW